MRLRSLSPSRRRRRAFTLIELIVSCGITMMLVVLVVSIVNGVLDRSRDVRQGSDSDRETALALDTVAADLEAMLVPQQEDGAALRLEMETVQGVPQPWVSLLTNAPDADGTLYSGTPRAVSLRVVDQDPVPGSTANSRPGLYRAVASGGDTFATASSTSDPQGNFWDTSSGASSHAWQDLLVDRIYSIQYRFQRGDNAAWIDPQTTGSSVRIDRHGAYQNLSGGSDELIPGGIRAIEVSLVLLDGQGELLVRSGAMTRADAFQRYGRHSARRTIVLPTGIGHGQ